MSWQYICNWTSLNLVADRDVADPQTDKHATVVADREKDEDKVKERDRQTCKKLWNLISLQVGRMWMCQKRSFTLLPDVPWEQRRSGKCLSRWYVCDWQAETRVTKWRNGSSYKVSLVLHYKFKVDVHCCLAILVYVFTRWSYDLDIWTIWNLRKLVLSLRKFSVRLQRSFLPVRLYLS